MLDWNREPVIRDGPVGMAPRIREPDILDRNPQRYLGLDLGG